MDTGFRVQLSALALSENGDAKYWYRGAQTIYEKITTTAARFDCA